MAHVTMVMWAFFYARSMRVWVRVGNAAFVRHIQPRSWKIEAARLLGCVDVIHQLACGPAGGGADPGGKTGLNLAQAGHQFDEIARAIAAVELLSENPVPAILHRAI